MRIVVANKFLYPKGGAERAVLDAGAELARRGHSVSYFGMHDRRNTVPVEASECVRSRDYRRRGPGAWRDAGSMLWSFEARRRFGKLLDRVRPDVVHCHNIYHQLTPSILSAARDRGIAVVMTAHDYKLVCPRYDMLRHGSPCDACVEDGPTACLRHRCVEGSLGRSLWLTAEAALHRLLGSYDPVRAIVTPSRFLRHVLLRAGVAPERLRFVPNFAPLPRAVGPAPVSHDRFVYVGRLSAEKGVATLVAAAAQLRRGTLVVCGEGPAASAVARAARDALPGRIELRGHLDSAAVAAELAAAAFAAVPSEWFENAPFAVLEAMAAGRGVLASRIGGLPELIEDGATGRLLPPGDTAAWTNALEHAIGSPEATAAWGQAARARAEREYSLIRHVDRLEALYHEVAT